MNTVNTERCKYRNVINQTTTRYKGILDNALNRERKKYFNTLLQKQ